jgi:hypothetical protein
MSLSRKLISNCPTRSRSDQRVCSKGQSSVPLLPEPPALVLSVWLTGGQILLISRSPVIPVAFRILQFISQF